MVKRRLFIGVPPAPENLAELALCQERFRDHPRLSHASDLVRWIRHENLHLTLHFLGAVETPRIETLMTELSATARLPAHSQRLDVACLFPEAGHARVAGVGGAPAAPLHELWGDLAETLRRLDFPVEERPLFPHVTLARLARPLRFMREEARALAPASPLDYRVERVTLFESVSSPSGGREGSHYAALAEFILAPPSPSC